VAVDSTLDMFFAPKERPPQVQIRGVKMYRPDEQELAAIVHLEQDEYREEYRRLYKQWPNAKAWLFWHRQHDKVVLRRGLR
jgi:hypothetical protein